MKLHSTLSSEAVLSNVGEVGEFRIRNSAKAFSILSSGLYANKIRAVIRELSCNAVDSHIAAGKATVPFDVHLPNHFEPWFSVRDYGTGLNHDQIVNIYTTYFESTKTNSNDYIGALGLGSKSPFSYVENFTVTAIKDGRRGVYTAFINDSGVPAIALMSENQTDDANGVEIKFAVENSYDFGKFRDEAQYVYKFFKLRPVVNGNSGYQHVDVKYSKKDLIPGVHIMSHHDSYHLSSTSIAIMGNIAYPIDVPNSEQVLGNKLAALLGHGLSIEFNIGELDFQASREGLSYIPATINAIRDKLAALDSAMYTCFCDEVDPITNAWEKAFKINKMCRENDIWKFAAVEYVKKNKTVFLDTWHNGVSLGGTKISPKELAEKYNISIDTYEYTAHRDRLSVTTIKENSHHNYLYVGPSIDGSFVINNVPNRVKNRMRFAFRNKTFKIFGTTCGHAYVITNADPANPVINLTQFFNDIHNPPQDMIVNASDLPLAPRAENKVQQVSASILELASYDDDDTVWNLSGKLEDYDNSVNYYYLPLKNRTVIGKFPAERLFGFYKAIKRGAFSEVTKIYGVRMSELDAVKGLGNWINLEDFIIENLPKMKKDQIDRMVVLGLDMHDCGLYNHSQDIVKRVSKLVNNSGSAIKQLDEIFKEIETEKTDDKSLKARSTLTDIYGTVFDETGSNLDTLIKAKSKSILDIAKKYPLLSVIEYTAMSKEQYDDEVVLYVNYVDQLKR